MQHQGPLLEDTSHLAVLLAVQTQHGLQGHLQGPGAPRDLRPGVCSHEGPACEAVLAIIVVGPLAQDHRPVQKTNC